VTLEDPHDLLSNEDAEGNVFEADQSPDFPGLATKFIWRDANTGAHALGVNKRKSRELVSRLSSTRLDAKSGAFCLRLKHQVADPHAECLGRDDFFVCHVGVGKKQRSDVNFIQAGT
jgi:hypothetical protein